MRRDIQDPHISASFPWCCRQKQKQQSFKNKRHFMNTWPFTPLIWGQRSEYCDTRGANTNDCPETASNVFALFPQAAWKRQLDPTDLQTHRLTPCYWEFIAVQRRHSGLHQDAFLLWRRLGNKTGAAWCTKYVLKTATSRASEQRLTPALQRWSSRFKGNETAALEVSTK